MDNRRAVTDIIYFAETILKLKLTAKQKEQLKSYEQGKVILSSYRNDRNKVKEVINKHKILCRDSQIDS